MVLLLLLLLLFVCLLLLLLLLVVVFFFLRNIRSKQIYFWGPRTMGSGSLPHGTGVQLLTKRIPRIPRPPPLVPPLPLPTQDFGEHKPGRIKPRRIKRAALSLQNQSGYTFDVAG